MSLRDKEFRSKNKICNCADLLVLLLLFYFNFTNNLLCNYVFWVPYFKFDGYNLKLSQRRHVCNC
jgi:hypothetical protein